MLVSGLLLLHQVLNAWSWSGGKLMCSKDKMSSMSLVSKMPGCIFEHNGHIPASAYEETNGVQPIEQAVYNNDCQRLCQLVEAQHPVTPHLKLGEMTCFEYASMKGYADILSTLLTSSLSKEVVKEYFTLEDVADRAQLISRNKDLFFGERAVMTEVNRYIASLFTSIVYNQPECLAVLLQVLGKHDLTQERFSKDNENFNAVNLAKYLGREKCLEVLNRRVEVA